MHVRFSLFFRLTRIKCRVFQPTEASVSCSNLSVAATYEHVDSTSSPTHLQPIGRGGKSSELDRGSTDTPRPAMPKDAGTGATLPMVALLGTLMSAPHLNKSHSKPLTSSLSWGPATTTSTMAVPCDTPSAPSVTRTSATASRDRPGVTTARSPMLIADDGTKGMRGDVVGCVAGR
jgi:hypothetical protein